MDIRYQVSVIVTRPVRPFEHGESVEDAADWMVSRDATRQLEKEIIQALRKIDGDCDAEVLETAREKTDDDEPRTIADGGHDTWAEFRGER